MPAPHVTRLVVGKLVVRENALPCFAVGTVENFLEEIAQDCFNHKTYIDEG